MIGRIRGLRRLVANFQAIAPSQASTGHHPPWGTKGAYGSWGVHGWLQDGLGPAAGRLGVPLQDGWGPDAGRVGSRSGTRPHLD
jgi:hypothetical protein